MNRPKSISDQLAYLKKSRKFWGWAVWLSASTMISSPIITVYVVINSLFGTFRELNQEEQVGEMQLAPLLERIFSVPVGATLIGGLLTIIAFVVFVISLIFVIKQGKALGALAEKVISDENKHSAIPQQD